MKALYKAGAHAGFELVDRPEPEAGPGDVKIRVMTTGICGTDLHIQSWDAWAQGIIQAPAHRRATSSTARWWKSAKTSGTSRWGTVFPARGTSSAASAGTAARGGARCASTP